MNFLLRIVWKAFHISKYPGLWKYIIKSYIQTISEEIQNDVTSNVW